MNKIFILLLIINLFFYQVDAIALSPYHESDHIMELTEPKPGDPRLGMIKRDLEQVLKGRTLFEDVFDRIFSDIDDIPKGHGKKLETYRHKKTGIYIIRKYWRDFVDIDALNRLARFPIANCCPILGVAADHYYELDLRPYGYVEISDTFSKMDKERDPRARLLIKVILANLCLISEANFVHGHLHTGNILINPKTGQLRFIDYERLTTEYSYRTILLEDLFHLIYSFYRKKLNYLYDIAIEESFKLCTDEDPIILRKYFDEINKHCNDPYTVFRASLLPAGKRVSFQSRVVTLKMEPVIAYKGLKLLEPDTEVEHARSHIKIIVDELERALHEEQYSRDDETRHLISNLPSAVRILFQGPKELDGIRSSL